MKANVIEVTRVKTLPKKDLIPIPVQVLHPVVQETLGNKRTDDTKGYWVNIHNDGDATHIYMTIKLGEYICLKITFQEQF